MNTREKIVTGKEARLRLPFEKPGSVVVGYFDPMLAGHVDSIAGLAAPIWIGVADPQEPLYPFESRLELVAALRGVSLVFPWTGGDDEAELAQANVVDLRERHLQLREQFLEQVRARHSQETERW